MRRGRRPRPPPGRPPGPAPPGAAPDLFLLDDGFSHLRLRAIWTWWPSPPAIPSAAAASSPPAGCASRSPPRRAPTPPADRCPGDRGPGRDARRGAPPLRLHRPRLRQPDRPGDTERPMAAICTRREGLPGHRHRAARGVRGHGASLGFEIAGELGSRTIIATPRRASPGSPGVAGERRRGDAHHRQGPGEAPRPARRPPGRGPSAPSPSRRSGNGWTGNWRGCRHEAPRVVLGGRGPPRGALEYLGLPQVGCQ